MVMTSSFDNLSLLRKSNSVDSTVETSIGSAGTDIELSHNDSKTIAKWSDEQTELFEKIIKKKESWKDDDWKALANSEAKQLNKTAAQLKSKYYRIKRSQQLN